MSSNHQLLLNSIKDALLLLDRDGYIKYANPATETLTGYSLSELIDQPLSIFYHDDVDNIKSQYELEQARRKRSFNVQALKVRKDNTLFWAECTLTPVEDEASRFVGYTCLLHDIDEKKREEVDLREKEESYRLMVQGVKEYAIFLLDPNGYIQTWNDGARRIKGYSDSEIIGKHFSTFYTSEDLDSKKPERELQIAISTGKYEEEGWRVKKNGSVFWANVVITALFNEQNKLIGFSKVTRDLTEKKNNEEALRQSEERYRSLVEQVTDYGIFMMDEKGRIMSWNEGAKRIKGYQASEVIGKYFSIFYPEEDIMNGKPSHELVVARAEGKYEEEGWRLRKDGSRFWASIVITAVYDNDAHLIGFSKVTRDLTERKESERALRESYDSARRLADELKATNTELSYANHELEQFTSIVSHDLQEPIRTIKSFLQLIDVNLGHEQSTELKNYVDKALTAANRMRELIQNLLHYSQLSKDEVVKEEVNVDDLIGAALQNLRTAVDKSNAQIIVENKLDKVEGDPIQLTQLIQNLLSNALKFTNSTNPKVRIEAFKENGHYKFAISDNGIGIANEDLKKVFEIFRRLNTDKKYPGTGIGLAICKKIVDRHEGHIWPESQPGKGTTFYFTLNEEKGTEQIEA